MKEHKKTNRVRMMAVPRDRDHQRLDNFLLAQLPGVPRSAIYKLIRTGQVRVDGKRAKPFQKLSTGEQVRIPPVHVQERRAVRVPDAVIARLEDNLLFEDQDMLVCNKPAGLAVHGGSGLDWGLIEALRQSRSNEQLDLVHRLDRETSGILLVAKNGKALRSLQARFAQRETEKRYLTLLQGRLPGDKWTVDEPLLKQEHGGERFMLVHPSGKPSLTRFLRLDNLGPATFAEAIPVTGRTHQIRAHALFLGAPCAGDARYLDEDSLRKWRRRGLERLFLHAHSLAFEDAKGTPQHFSCPLPDELKQTMDRL